MKEKCGNCKFWQEIENGFPAFCQNILNKEKFQYRDKSLNEPEYNCDKHEYEEQLYANMIQYPSRFITKSI